MTNDHNPYCVRCHRRMHRRGPNYICPGCQTATRAHFPRGARYFPPVASCVNCRRPLARVGLDGNAQRFRCNSCGALVRASRSRVYRHQLTAEDRRRGKRVQAAKRAEAGARKAAEIMRAAASLAPAHLPADVREEVAQAIAVDLLAGAVTLDQLDARRLRVYVRDAYGFQNRFQFLSLDAPRSDEDGRTLGESIAA